MSQLEKAEEAIKEMYDAGYREPIMVKYYLENLKPKDKMFEKFEELLRYYICVGYKHDECYTKFKEIFKDELNGTKGLDEAIEYVNTSAQSYCPLGKLKAIKSRLEGESCPK